jgi:DNA-binding IclR family transcriptional regulator
MQGNNKRGTIKSGYRLFRVIEALQELEEARVSELAEYCDMNSSHIHKYLKTLENAGYATNNEGLYELSFLFVNHAERVKCNSALYQEGKKRVDQLANEIGDVIKLSVRQGDQSIVVYSKNDENIFFDGFMPGKMNYLHHTSPGKAILAEFSDDELEKYIEETGLLPRNKNTITDPTSFREEIAAIRDRGFAISEGEWNTEINGISSSIRCATEPLGAINILGPANTHSNEQLITEYANEVRQIASQIEYKLAQ